MPDEGFRMAGAYVDVNLDDHTESDYEALRARIESEGDVKIAATLADPDVGKVRDEAQAKADADPVKIPATVDKDTLRSSVDDAARSTSADAEAAGKTIGDDITVGADGRLRNARGRFVSAGKDLGKGVGEGVSQGVGGTAPDAEEAGKKIGKSASKGAKDETSKGMSGMAALITAGIVLGAPIAGAAMVAGIGAGIAGVGALVERNNVQVQASFHQLSGDVVAEMHAASDQVVPYLTSAAQSLDREFALLGPDIQDAMSQAGPDIATLTGGLDRFANNTMPGVDDAMKQSQPVMQGTADLMSNVGTAGSQTLTVLSQHAAGFGSSMQAAGGIVEAVLPTAGHLIGDLGDIMGQQGGRIDSAISGITGDITQLGDGAVPVLSTAIGVTTSAVTGMTDALEPVAPELGAIGAAALVGFGGFKLAGLVSSGVEGLASGVLKLGSVAESVSPKLGGMLGKAAAALEGAAGPIGIGAVAIGGLIGLMMENENAGKESTQELADAADALGQSLRQSSGALDDNVVATLQSQQAYKDLLPQADQLNISQETLTNAILKGGPALDGLNSQLGKVADSNQHWVTVAGGEQVADGYSDTGKAANALRYNVDNLATSFVQQQQAQAKLQIAMENWTGSATGKFSSALVGFNGQVQISADSVTTLDGDLKVLDTDTSSAKDATKALESALDILTGRTLSLSDAEEDMNKAVDQSNKTITDGIKKTQGWGTALLGANGEINTASQNGQKLNDDLKALRSGMEESAKAAYNYAVAHGDSAEAITKVTGVAQQARDQFLKEAEAMGISAGDAASLADSMGMIPSEIGIQFAAKGDQDVEQAADKVLNSLRGLPPKTDLVIDAPTQQVQDALTQVGEEITKLPDGKVVIGANTDPLTVALHAGLATVDESTGTITVKADTHPAYDAHHNLIGYVNASTGTATIGANAGRAYDEHHKLIGYVDGSSGTITVFGNAGPAYAAVSSYLAWASKQSATVNILTNDVVRHITENLPPGVGGGAIGGIAMHAAGSIDVPSLFTPMQPVAQVVPPNTMRVVGDRASGDEAFIPLDGSPRSKAILQEAAANPKMAGTLGGSTYAPTVTNHIYQQPQESGVVLAARVSAQTSWDLRSGRPG